MYIKVRNSDIDVWFLQSQYWLASRWSQINLLFFRSKYHTIVELYHLNTISDISIDIKGVLNESLFILRALLLSGLLVSIVSVGDP